MLPEKTHSVSVAIDRASVPIEVPLPRPRGRPRKGVPRRPVKRVYEMCYCATVTIHDENGKALHTIRRGAMPNRDPNDLCRLLANDVFSLQGKRPRSKLRLSLLADGAPELWNLFDAHFPASVFGEVDRRIDFCHVVEKLAAATKVIHQSDDAAAHATHARWRHALLDEPNAVPSILAQLHASGCENTQLDGERPVHDAITYLTNGGDRMAYATAVEQGLPIGSGNVEATCKSLVGIRMKRCGSRWHHDTGNHVLHLRALALSDRWQNAMDRMGERRRTAVRKVAA
jgi:hypothetical protein